MKDFKVLLKEARLKSGLTQQEVADMVGIAQRTYSMYESGERSPKANVVIKLENALKCSHLAQALFGLNEVKPVANEDFMMVPYLPASAQAGYALGFNDNTPPENIRTMLVPREYEKGLYMVIEIIGESMDDDTSRAIVNGDKLLIKELDRGSWVFRLPFKRSLFVIVTKDGVVCKQIIDHDLDRRTITCHSFNPSFEDFTLSLETDVLQLFVVKKIVEKQIRF